MASPSRGQRQPAASPLDNRLLDSIAREDLRDSNANIADFWKRIEKSGLTNEQAGELISGAYDYVDACRLQRNTATVRKGEEISEHTEFKSELLAAGDVTLLKKIEIAERVRKRWGERRVKRFKDQISRLARDLECALTQVISSPTLSVKFARILLDGQLNRTRQTLRQLDAALEVNGVVSQSKLHVRMRKKALVRMLAETMAPKKPSWGLIAAAIYLASGERLDISANDLSKEYRSQSITPK